MNQPLDDSTAGHVEHCLWQVIRFAYQLERGWLEGSRRTLRVAQLGFNLGRFDELTGDRTGRTWTQVDQLLGSEDWPALQSLATEWLHQFGLEEPPVAHLRRL